MIKRVMKTGGKKLAKANYGMAVTGDPYAKAKMKYPNKEKEFKAIETKDQIRNKAFADAALVKTLMEEKAKKEALTKQTDSMKKTTMKTGGIINPNPSTKVKPSTPKMKNGGMAKAMYGKPVTKMAMMKKGGKKK